jgi:DNA-binding response OmpR family regulator
MPDRPLNGARVLVVEDEPLIALEICEALADAGATIVGPALKVSTARALAATGTLSAAVLDVRVGPELVFPVADVLTGRNIPFVFHTGDLRGEELCAGWSGTEILPKPARTDALVAAVARLLARG